MDFKGLFKEYVMDLDASPNPPQAVVTATPTVISGLPGIPGLPGQPGAAGLGALPIAGFEPGQIDASMSSTFIEKLKSKYLGSPTYPVIEQFTNSLETLAEFIPDEGSRYRAALKQLVKTGVDGSKLADAYNALVTVLDTENGKFATKIAQQRAAEITTREETVKDINLQIEAKNLEIRALMDQRETVAGEIVDTKTKLDTAQNSFDGAMATLRSQNDDSLRKLSIYLPINALASAAK